jgi:hypothetical protein
MGVEGDVSRAVRELRHDGADDRCNAFDASHVIVDARREGLNASHVMVDGRCEGLNAS